MFERYTEKARRVIFFARYEASKCGSPYIETAHLRASLHREAGSLFDRFGVAYEPPKAAAAPLTTVDLPLSEASKRALQYALEEAEWLASPAIGPGHLLLGVLREEGAEVYKIRRATLEESWPDTSKAAPALVDVLRDFDSRVTTATEKLLEISEAAASEPLREGGWSRKQILGHLIDSAANNHQRFVRAQLEELHVSRGYAQQEWVESQQYQRAPWKHLISLWAAYNRHLVHIASCIPEETLKHLVKIAGNASVTLEFVITDYAAHLEHHLKQIGV